MVVDLVFGFLGSGKTTFISRALHRWGNDEKIVVVVNEFGDVGIDGDLLDHRGASVVEMPSGCICCSLRTDFRAQLLEIERTIGPDRIIIEPSGVATVTQIQNVFTSQVRDGKLAALNKILIADVAGFMDLYRSNRYYVESQARHAHIVLLNKCDRVGKQKALLMRSAISALNPEITVFMTRFGEVDWRDYRHALAARVQGETPPVGSSSGKAVIIETVAPPAGVPVHSTMEAAHRHPDHSHGGDAAGRPGDHHPSDPNNPFAGFESMGQEFDQSPFSMEKVEAFFRELRRSDSSAFGQIVRAKGIFQASGKWRVFELASGEISSQPIRPAQQSKIAIIGTALKRKRIHAALNSCLNIPRPDHGPCHSA